MTVTNLTETVPTGASAAEWYFLWTYTSGGTKTTYFANAELQVTPGSVPTFSDGTVTLTGNSHSYNKSSNTNDTGHFTLGKYGVVEIDVPLANIGNPPTGAVLAGPTGETDILIGVIGSGLLEKVDTGGPTCDYKVGSNPGPVTAVAASHQRPGELGRPPPTPASRSRDLARPRTRRSRAGRAGPGPEASQPQGFGARPLTNSRRAHTAPAGTAVAGPMFSGLRQPPH